MILQLLVKKLMFVEALRTVAIEIALLSLFFFFFTSAQRGMQDCALSGSLAFVCYVSLSLL